MDEEYVDESMDNYEMAILRSEIEALMKRVDTLDSAVRKISKLCDGVKKKECAERISAIQSITRKILRE